MKVRLAAMTEIDSNELADVGYIPQETWEYQADELTEFAGRWCYKSWDRPNPNTAANDDYIANIIKQQHWSVMGHAHASFAVTGVSRAMLLELERHAEHMNINFSVVSQRYVDHSDARFVVPPALTPLLDENAWGKSDEALNETLEEALTENILMAQALYEQIVKLATEKGLSRKEARGAARAVLPEGTETEFLVTGSLRAWRDIISKRLSPAADQEIREFAHAVLEILVESVAPNCFQDMVHLLEPEED